MSHGSVHQKVQSDEVGSQGFGGMQKIHQRVHSMRKTSSTISDTSLKPLLVLRFDLQQHHGRIYVLLVEKLILVVILSL